MSKLTLKCCDTILFLLKVDNSMSVHITYFVNIATKSKTAKSIDITTEVVLIMGSKSIRFIYVVIMFVIDAIFCQFCIIFSLKDWEFFFKLIHKNRIAFLH